MHLLVKVLHIVAVIAFLGNITTGLFWHAHAARTRRPELLAFAMDGIIRSDRLFTIPAVIAIAATGVVNALQGGIPILRTGWIFWTIVLSTVSGVIFALRVAPLQRQLLAHAEVGQRSGDFEYAAYHAKATRWERWGALALLTPVLGLVLMVFKPGL